MNDLISRQAAIEALEEQIEQCNKSLSSFDISIKDEFAVKVERASLVTFRETLEYLPTAEPQRIKGKWALQSDDYHEYYECDQCGIAVGIDDIRNFCPNCGADMREDNKKKMKSLKQVQREEKIGTVYTTKKFAECIRRGSFNSFDGVGFFHDGKQKTDKCVWDYILTWDDVENYPYVVWYNK